MTPNTNKKIQVKLPPFNFPLVRIVTKVLINDEEEQGVCSYEQPKHKLGISDEGIKDI